MDFHYSFFLLPLSQHINLLTDEIVSGDDVIATYDEESKDVKFYHTITINK